MRVLSTLEGRDWAQSAGLPTPDEEPVHKGFIHEVDFRVPGDAGRKTALARAIAGAFADKGQLMFWISDWSAWPNSTNLRLFKVLRKSYGDERDLIEAECQVFEEGETDDLELFLDLALYFSWDALLGGPSSNVLLKFSNDEIIEVHGKDLVDFTEVKFILTEYKLVPVESDEQS